MNKKENQIRAHFKDLTMRKIMAGLLLGVAAATYANVAQSADYKPIYKAPPAVFDPLWAGFYFGGHIGGGHGEKKFIDNFPVYDGELDGKPKLNGFLGGVQAGYNFQWNWFVLGVEGDFSWADVKKEKFNCFFFGDQICSAESQWFGTIAGRVGGAVGPFLIYGKGGVAWVQDKYTNIATCSGSQPIVRAGVIADCGDLYVGHNTRPGWLAGIGVEYLINRRWSLKAEYNYMDFGKKSVFLIDPDGDAFTEEIHQRVNLVKVGFNYHFDPGPPAISARAQATPGPISTGGADEGTLSTIDFFAGADVARQVVTGWAGAFISLSGDLDTSGPRLMILGGGGRYRYSSGGVSYRGLFSFGDVLAGYGLEGENYSINLLAGVSAANHSVEPFDPTNAVQGTEAGPKVRASLYARPTPRTLVYGEVDYTTAFKTFATEGKVGYDFLGAEVFFGPEASYFNNERSENWRVGAHVSEIKLGAVSVDVSGGYSQDTILGKGAYGRVGLSRRY